MKWSELLGPKLQTKEGLQDTDHRLAGKKVDLYQDTIRVYLEFELVSISSDSDLKEYNEFSELLMFPAIPFDERTTLRL
ncbi:unnamed protein product [Peronospora destructor]|uniref:Uncharacterized protein n=1 Tax=Peronospora destructor TaxID=86335 RepID=A0AAV0TGI3_9STRA|nr:unnamed protein product [Peronospora destructor]